MSTPFAGARPSNPRIFGVAGGGLSNSSGWAVNPDVARIGAAGEVRTADLLNTFALPGDGVTVLHDLRIPIPGFTANVDHVVVSGRTVHIIDAKVWKPAFYWTLGGRTRRGVARFKPADKQTMVMAQQHLARHLAGTRATFATPVVAVWPSSKQGSLHVGWLKIPGARAMTGPAFERHAQRTFGRKGRPADPAVVHALTSLLVSKPRRKAS